MGFSVFRIDPCHKTKLKLANGPRGQQLVTTQCTIVLSSPKTLTLDYTSPFQPFWLYIGTANCVITHSNKALHWGGGGCSAKKRETVGKITAGVKMCTGVNIFISPIFTPFIHKQLCAWVYLHSTLLTHTCAHTHMIWRGHEKIPSTHKHESSTQQMVREKELEQEKTSVWHDRSKNTWSVTKDPSPLVAIFN